MVMLLCLEAWIYVTVMFRNSWRWHSRGFGSFSLWIRGLYHCMKALYFVLFVSVCGHITSRNSLHVSVCVFSDRTMANQQLAFVAGQRVCLFWPHDGVSAAVIHCTWSRCRIRESLRAEEFLQASVCVFSDRTMAYQQPSFIACRRIRCRPACVSFLTAWWHIGTWNSLRASVCVFSDRTMAYQQP